MLENTWLRRDSPMARAYRLLENLDLGPDLNGKDAVGQIDFLDAPNMYSWYLGVQTEDPLSVSLLQKRLNDLNTGVRYDHTPSEWAEHLRRMGGAGMSLPASIAARLQSPEPPQEQGPAQDSGPRRSRKWPLDFVALSLNE
jgi:hypothetical protein